jgi:hypothetical protein
MRSEPDIKWIMQTVREAAWAPLLVLCPVVAAEKIFDAFKRFPWIDVPAHFFGGIAVTYFFWCAFTNAQSLAGHLRNVSQAVLALACTASTAILWEIVEFLSDRLLLTHLQHGAGDTLSDLVFGLAGSVAYLVLRRAFAAPPGAHASPEPPDERA